MTTTGASIGCDRVATVPDPLVATHNVRHLVLDLLLLLRASDELKDVLALVPGLDMELPEGLLVVKLLVDVVEFLLKLINIGFHTGEHLLPAGLDNNIEVLPKLRDK